MLSNTGLELTILFLLVKRRFISTSSLSATSTPASRLLPVGSSIPSYALSFSSSSWSIYRTFDLQVWWYRQAYYREIREGTAGNFFTLIIAPPRCHVGGGGAKHLAQTFCASQVLRQHPSLVSIASCDLHPHILFGTVVHSLSILVLTGLSGSRRVGQGFIQVRMGARQTQGRA